MEVDVEAVCEHERLARQHVGRDLFVIQVGLNVIGDQDHDDVGGLGGFGDGHDFEAGGFGLGPRFAAGIEPDHDVHAGIAKVQRMGVALASISDNGDDAPIQVVQIPVFFVVTFRHLRSVRGVIHRRDAENAEETQRKPG